MCEYMAFFFSIPLVAGAVVSALLWLAAGIGGLPPLPAIWIAIAGLAAAFAALCAVLAAFATKVFDRVEQTSGENAQFERAILVRVSHLEAAMERPRPQPATAVQSAPARLAETLRSGARAEPAAPPALVAIAPSEPPAESGNVVQLDPAARIRAQKEKRGRGSSPEIVEAIANGRYEAWYQPVLGLPDRKPRHLSGHAYLMVEGSNPLAPKYWLEAASNEGRLPEIDRYMLLQGIKLCRDLARQEKACGVFWRFNRATLADQAAWLQIIEVLRANKALSGLFVCEIRHADYNELRLAEMEALYAIKEAGFELCLADCTDLQGHAASARPGMFKYVSAATDVIVHAPNGGAPISRDITCIATGVESEEDAISLIDRDVPLAQGPFLAPPKPLRRDGNGGQAANGAGLRQP